MAVCIEVVFISVCRLAGDTHDVCLSLFACVCVYNNVCLIHRIWCIGTWIILFLACRLSPGGDGNRVCYTHICECGVCWKKAAAPLQVQVTIKELINLNVMIMVCVSVKPVIVYIHIYCDEQRTRSSNTNASPIHDSRNKWSLNRLNANYFIICQQFCLIIHPWLIVFVVVDIAIGVRI